MARVLLAEDDGTLRQFLARALVRAGHEVVAVASGAEALPILARAPVDLLLTDIVMPGMDGIELARRAHEDDPALKVVFITGFAAVAMQQKDRLASEPRVLSKPFHLKDVVDAIDRLLAA